MKEKMLLGAKLNIRCSQLFDILDHSKKDDEFDDELFEFGIELYKKTHLKEDPCDLDFYATMSLMSAAKNFSVRDSFKDRDFLIKYLEKVKDKLKTSKFKTEHYTIDFDSLIKKLENFYDVKKPICPIDKPAKEEFLQTFFENKKQGEYSNFEKTLIEAIPKLKTFNKGLNLKYSREEFLKDLFKAQISDEIFSKLNIEPVVEDDKIIGYDGLIELENLDKNNPFEFEIYKLCHKFLYENEVQTDDEKLDCALNTIIKAMPEFINIIGKTQHKTHDYTVDVHSLLVLSGAINNPQYLSLKDTDKTADDLFFLVHMVDEDKIKEELEKVKLLSSSANQGMLSCSLV